MPAPSSSRASPKAVSTPGTEAPALRAAAARSRTRASSTTSPSAVAARMRRLVTRCPTIISPMPSAPTALPSPPSSSREAGSAPTSIPSPRPTTGRQARSRAVLRGPARAARREASARPDSATPPATVWRMSARGAPRAVDRRQEATAPGTPAAVARLCRARRPRGGGCQRSRPSPHRGSHESCWRSASARSTGGTPSSSGSEPSVRPARRQARVQARCGVAPARRRLATSVSSRPRSGSGAPVRRERSAASAACRIVGRTWASGVPVVQPRGRPRRAGNRSTAAARATRTAAIQAPGTGPPAVPPSCPTGCPAGGGIAAEPVTQAMPAQLVAPVITASSPPPRAVRQGRRGRRPAGRSAPAAPPQPGRV